MACMLMLVSCHTSCQNKKNMYVTFTFETAAHHILKHFKFGNLFIKQNGYD